MTQSKFLLASGDQTFEVLETSKVSPSSSLTLNRNVLYRVGLHPGIAHFIIGRRGHQVSLQPARIVDATAPLSPRVLYPAGRDV
jgi:hypothetical protein